MSIFYIYCIHYFYHNYLFLREFLVKVRSPVRPCQFKLFYFPGQACRLPGSCRPVTDNHWNHKGYPLRQWTAVAGSHHQYLLRQISIYRSCVKAMAAIVCNHWRPPWSTNTQWYTRRPGCWE